MANLERRISEATLQWRTCRMLQALTGKPMIHWLKLGKAGRRSVLEHTNIYDLVGVLPKGPSWKMGRWLIKWSPWWWEGGWWKPGHLRIQRYGPPRFDEWWFGPVRIRRYDEEPSAWLEPTG